MRIHSRHNATQIFADVQRFDPNTGAPSVEQGVYEPSADDGSFDVPPALHAHLMGLHIDGVKAWEDDVERADRLTLEEAARRKDPATLLAAVEQGANGNPALLDRLDQLITLLKSQHTDAEHHDLHAAEQLEIEKVIQAPADPAPQSVPTGFLPEPPVVANPTPSSDGNPAVAPVDPTPPVTTSTSADTTTIVTNLPEPVTTTTSGSHAAPGDE